MAFTVLSYAFGSLLTSTKQTQLYDNTAFNRDRSLPYAARSYLATESSGTSTAWTESYDNDGVMDTFDFGGGDIRARYQASVDGVYYAHAQATHDSLNTLSITSDGAVDMATCPNIGAAGGAVSGVFMLNANDYIKFAYTHTAGNFTVGSASTYFEVFKLPHTEDY
jgi:hypothetical protein